MTVLWPDSKLLAELPIAPWLLDTLAKANIVCCGDARALSDAESGRVPRVLNGKPRTLGQEAVAFLRHMARGPRCDVRHPRGTGRIGPGRCWLDRGHHGRHEDSDNHHWGDPHAIPDEATIHECRLTKVTANRLRAAGLMTAGAVRATSWPIPGMKWGTWQALTALGLTCDSELCGAASPLPPLPKGRYARHRPCIRPAKHAGEHADLVARVWPGGPASTDGGADTGLDDERAPAEPMPGDHGVVAPADRVDAP